MVHEGLIAIAEKEREVTYSGQLEICPTKHCSSINAAKPENHNESGNGLPWASSALPHNTFGGPADREPGQRKAHGRRRRRSHRISLSFRRATPSRTTRLFFPARSGNRKFRRTAPKYSLPTTFPDRSSAIPRPPPSGQGIGSSADHRESKWSYGGRLDRLRQTDSANRCRWAGVEHLFCALRSKRELRRESRLNTFGSFRR